VQTLNVYTVHATAFHQLSRPSSKVTNTIIIICLIKGALLLLHIILFPKKIPQNFCSIQKVWLFNFQKFCFEVPKQCKTFFFEIFLKFCGASGQIFSQRSTSLQTHNFLIPN
jgi:hypothetical protein